MDGITTDESTTSGHLNDVGRGFVRVHVSVTPEVADLLTTLKELYGTSATHVIGLAIRRLAWLEERVRDGARIVVEERDGTIREVVFR